MSLMLSLFGVVNCIPCAFDKLSDLLPLPGFMSSATEQAYHIIEHITGIDSARTFNQLSSMGNDFFPTSAKSEEFCQRGRGSRIFCCCNGL